METTKIASSYQSFATIRLAIQERLRNIPFKLEVDLRAGGGNKSFNLDDFNGSHDLDKRIPLRDAKRELPASGRIIVSAYRRNDDFLNDYIITLKDKQVVAVDGEPWEAPLKAAVAPNITARKKEVEEEVRASVKKLVALLRRSKRFHASTKATPNIRMSFHPSRRKSWGGKKGVSFSLLKYVQNDRVTMKEYASFAADPEIGTYTGHWRNTVRVLVAHEVAHWAQYAAGVEREPGLNYKQPHGSGFKEIYRYLRAYILRGTYAE